MDRFIRRMMEPAHTLSYHHRVVYLHFSYAEIRDTDEERLWRNGPLMDMQEASSPQTCLVRSATLCKKLTS
jgi:hypothetical protein